MRTQPWSLAAAAALVLAFCASCEQEATPSANRIDATYQSLAGQFRACVTNGMACLKAANCDEAQNQICRDQFATCRDAARAAAEAFHAAVRECRAEARACKGDAGDADDGGARRACFDELKMCVAENKPERAPAPPCLAELRECIQADGSEPRACMMTAHQCFIDSLPPRCDGDGGVIDGGWDFGDRGGRRGGGDHDGDRGDGDRGDGDRDGDRGDGDRGDGDRGDRDGDHGDKGGRDGGSNDSSSDAGPAGTGP